MATKAELKKYLDNKNVQYFLYQIFKGESDKDGGVVNLAGFNRSGPDPKNNYWSSSAFGSQQFTGVTRNDVLERYGIDAWSKDVDEQQMATLALLSMDETLEDVAKGDYDSTIERGRWEAFTKRPTLLTGNKPNDWEVKYNDFKSNAVYDPKKSWDKIPDKNKIGKIKLFNGKKYGPIMKELGLSDTINSNIGKTQLNQILNLSDKETFESSINLGLSKEEQTAANIVGDAKKLVEIHDATINVKTEVEDQNAFRVTVDGISRSFANDLKDGRFKGDDDESRSEYFKRISNAFGWSDIDQLNPEQLGVARGQVEEFFQYTKGQAYGERIGGDQSWDSLFEDMTEDKYYRSLELSQEIGIPPAGRAPKKVYAELSGNPITMQMIEGSYNTDNGYDSRKLIYNEGVYDSYLANKAPKLREQISSGENSLEEVVDYLGKNQTETYITSEGEENKISQPIVDSELFPEETALLDDPDEDIDEDVDEDFEVEDVNISVAPDVERTLSSLTQEELADYEGWLSDNPDGSFEDWNKLPAASTAASAESDDYFDLRGEGVFEESFLDKLGGVSSLIGLATGAIGLGAALKDVDIPKDPKLGPAFQQRLSESKRLAQQGLTPSELAKAHNDLDSSYATGIENIVRGSAGNRAQFLAGLGGLDVARQSALMDIAVADAGMQRQNQQKYDSMMMVNEQYEAGRQAKYQDAKFAQDTAKQAAGAALAGTSMSMIANSIGDRHLNRYNKMKTEKLMMDMGYKATKDGKSGQKQLGTDKNGDKMQTSFSLNDLPGGDNYEAPNLLSGSDQAVNTKAQGINPQTQGANPQAQVFNSPIIQPSYPNINQGAQPFQNPNNIGSSLSGSTTSGLINYSNDNQVNLSQNLYDIFK